MKRLYLLTWLLAASLLTVGAKKKQAVQQLWPDRTPVSQWFCDTAKVDVSAFGKQYVLTDYGVTIDSTVIQTSAIQQVIDYCAEEGGGVIVVPKGTFLTGALFFKKGTHLHFEDGGKLKGIDDIRHYPLIKMHMEGKMIDYFAALVTAEHCDGFTITGRGIIDGNGKRFWDEFWIRRKQNPKCTNLEALRPQLVYISHSDDVTIQDVRLINSPFWTSHLYHANHVKFLDCFIKSPAQGTTHAPSSDAIDLDICDDVMVRGCYINICDDGVCLKGGKGTYVDQDSTAGAVNRVIVDNCRFGPLTNAGITFGSEAWDCHNVIMRNCQFDNSDHILLFKMRPDTPQQYGDVLMENCWGTSKYPAIEVSTWTQFYDKNARPDIPESSVRNVTIRGLKIKTSSFFRVLKTHNNMTHQFALSNFTFENIEAEDKNKAFDIDQIDGVTVKNVLLNGVNKAPQPLTKAILNGVPWYDQKGKPVSAHGANIMKDGDKYYLFGEYKTDSANVFSGFSCYSSDDLCNWRFERIAFSQQKDGRMGPSRVGERPKVLKCPATGEYVMLMHSDNLRYKDPCVCYATSKTVNGEYTFQGPLLYKGQPIKKWDIGSFMDNDGQGYLLVHHGYIYRLAPDFHSADSCLMNGLAGTGESPAMFKKDGIYYWLSSHTTSWERNDNMYFTSKSLSGPWQYGGEFAPKGSLTWNSQCSFVLTLPDGTPMYMGDRWSFPRQQSAATYVWLPMRTNGNDLMIPDYWEAWSPATVSRLNLATQHTAGGWTGEKPGDTYTQKINGGQHIAIYGTTDSQSGYAGISIKDNKGREVFATSIDFYSKIPATGLRWVSPKLPKGSYTLKVRVSDMKPNWTDKAKTQYGSTDYQIKITEIAYI